jgi:hypothetical protein
MHTEIDLQDKQSSSNRLKGVRPLGEKPVTKKQMNEQQLKQLEQKQHEQKEQEDQAEPEQLKEERHQEKLLQEKRVQEKVIKDIRRPMKSLQDSQLDDSRHFHKTKLLLSIYRTVVWRIEGAIGEVQVKANEYGSGRIAELIDFLSLELDEYDLKRDKKVVEERLMCIAQTKHMIEIIDKALKHLRNHPINGQLYHDIITHCYIKQEIMSNEAIIHKLNLTSSSFYRHKKEATKLMGIALWGYIIPPLRDFWDGVH